MAFTLSDWIRWYLSIHPDELVWISLPLLLLDAPRYTLGIAIMWAMDVLKELGQRLTGRAEPAAFQHCPTVCVVVAGLNEAETLPHTLASLWGTYPKMEVVIVDDGSTDGMTRVAKQFQIGKSGVTVLRKPRRGGKSSALNFALPFTNAEIIVCVDGDSNLNETSIWEIVQPFADPRVAAVSGTVLARHPFHNLVTWMQASEYLRSIFLGRRLAARLNLLGIVSGAFGAYRRDALRRIGGWDVGPGEDGDLSLRLRKIGYRIAFAPYAQCFTNPPTSVWALIRQRRRWEWAVVTFECRKHVDMANLWNRNFRFSNLVLLVDRWLYNIVFQVLFWAYIIWCIANPSPHLVYQFAFYYFAYLLLEAIQIAFVFYYSNRRLRDLLISLVFPLMPIYQLVHRLVATWSVLEEMVTRRSFRDTFVPAHVRRVTWHW